MCFIYVSFSRIVYLKKIIHFRVELLFEKMYLSKFKILVYLTFSVQIHNFKNISLSETKFQQSPFNGLLTVINRL